MRVKLFTSDTMNDAMAQVKKELGRDAVILHTKRLRKGGVLGFFGKEMVEVLAAVDSTPIVSAPIVPNPPKKPAPPDADGAANWPMERPGPDAFFPEPEDTSISLSSPEGTAGGRQFASLKSEISSIKKMMEQFMDVISSPDKFDSFQNASPLFKLLVKNEVDPAVAAELVKGIPKEQASRGLESETARQVLTERIAQYLKNIEGINLSPHVCKKVALIGPTGVGKTTTIAKLAANFTIKQGYKVALITADTYRIAAIEQLRIYADIIGIPLEIVYSPEELRNAFNRHTDKHLILIDNAGRSPSNSEQLAELKNLLEIDPAIETHLVLSATIRYKEALEAANKFSVCSPNKILFTKIDESCTLGTLLNILYHFPSTLSYVTTGQSVPEDIELADANKLASLMLKDF